jgi:hypothetical protein
MTLLDRLIPYKQKFIDSEKKWMTLAADLEERNTRRCALLNSCGDPISFIASRSPLTSSAK